MLLFVGIALIGKLFMLVKNCYFRLISTLTKNWWKQSTIHIFTGFVRSECKNPSTFGSFNGKPAENISKLSSFILFNEIRSRNVYN